MKEYINAEGKHINCIEVEVKYYKDFAKRGYYLNVTPIEKKTGDYGTSYSYEICAYSGHVLLKEVARKSDKAFVEACKIADGIKQDIINDVCEKRGIKLIA